MAAVAGWSQWAALRPSADGPAAAYDGQALRCRRWWQRRRRPGDPSTSETGARTALTLEVGPDVLATLRPRDDVPGLRGRSHPAVPTHWLLGQHLRYDRAL